MPYLEIRKKDDPERMRRVPLDRPSLSIGRSSSNCLQLRDTAVSRCHCIVETSDGGVRVIDVGSRHGLRVNRVRCRDASLADGDQVKVGPYLLTYRSRDEVRSNGQAKVEVTTVAKSETDPVTEPERRTDIARMRTELATLRAEAAARDSQVTARLQALAARTEELETERLELLLRAERAEADRRKLVDRLHDQPQAAPARARDTAGDLLPIEQIFLSGPPAPATTAAGPEVGDRSTWLPTVVVTATLVLLLVAWLTLS